MSGDWLRDLAARATPGPWRYINGHGIETDEADVLIPEGDYWTPDAELAALAPDLARVCADLAEVARLALTEFDPGADPALHDILERLDAALATYDALDPEHAQKQEHES